MTVKPYPLAVKENKYQILHLINLLGTDNEWRDTERTKAEPKIAESFKVKYYYTDDVNSVYLISDSTNSSGFYLLGAQYRAYQEATDTPGGIRFAARIVHHL